MDDSRPFPRKVMGNGLGAVSDGAILFPILTLLVLKGGYSAAMLLTTAGITYIAAGFFFRIPMAVQPLKALTMGAIAIGATFDEIRIAGILVGILCATFLFVDTNLLSRKVPRHLVHGVQLGLGVILVTRGFQIAVASSPNLVGVCAICVIAYATIVGERHTRLPILGLISVVGMVFSLRLGAGASALALHSNLSSSSLSVRPLLIVSLVLPQIALTLANSVVATDDAARRYFGARAHRVTPRSLLGSISIGNVLFSAIGGLPFCHGSGGLTAHVRGGARDWSMNLFIGCGLLALSLFPWMGGSLAVKYPSVLLSPLLIAIGVFHMGLAQPSWVGRHKCGVLVVMAGVTLLTQNLLWTLLVGAALELAFYRRHQTTLKVSRP